jgi:putative lipoic acid-binding regulatory protein
MAEDLHPKDPKESLLKFPCDFPIKVFGLASDEFENEILMLIHKHAPSASDRAIQARHSGQGKYCALSITVHVESKEQLDKIYQELTSSPHVLMAL